MISYIRASHISTFLQKSNLSAFFFFFFWRTKKSMCENFKTSFSWSGVIWIYLSALTILSWKFLSSFISMICVWYIFLSRYSLINTTHVFCIAVFFFFVVRNRDMFFLNIHGFACFGSLLRQVVVASVNCEYGDKRMTVRITWKSQRSCNFAIIVALVGENFVRFTGDFYTLHL